MNNNFVAMMEDPMDDGILGEDEEDEAVTLGDDDAVTDDALVEPESDDEDEDVL